MTGEKPFWTLYLLRCSDGTLYTGVTTDLERRLREHNTGRGSRYTAGRRPVWPMGAWAFPDRSSAQQGEARLRRWSRQEKELLALSGQPFEGAPFCGPAPHRYCPRCGSSLEAVLRPHDELPRQICTTCGRIHYRNAKPCAGALVAREGKLLLVKRAIMPFRGYWDIPGGFVEEGELPETTAVREVVEETGLEVRLTGLFGFILDRYVYQEEMGITLNVYFDAEVVGGTEQAGDDAAQVGWFSPSEIPTRIAFDHARMIMEQWVERERTTSPQ
jgi:ADP-ribose pyrophosphatase YjhB (NUDIX family)/predicted GIY-YIG superfamily endonuclease